MASQVDVCNSALRKLGQDIGIASLSEQTKTARVLNSLWRQCSDYVFSEHWWPFAVKEAWLELQVQTPPHGWAFRYQYPQDCITLLDVGDATDFDLHRSLGLAAHQGTTPFAYQVVYGDQETSVISNIPDAQVRYVARIEDVGRWPVKFAETVSCRLAMDAAASITGTVGLEMQNSLLQKYEMARSKAVVHDWNESLEATQFVSPSLASR